MNRWLLRILGITALIAAFAGPISWAGNQVAAADFPEPSALKLGKIADQKFAQIGGKPYGIVMTDEGTMLAVKDGREIVKIASDGQWSVLCRLDEGNSSAASYIWSLTLGPDGNVYAPAMDRVLKITPVGEITVVVNDPEIKPMGLAFDSKGDMYVTSKTKVFKFTPALEKSLFIDDGGSLMYGFGLAGISFDPKFGSLLVVNYSDRQVYRYPFRSDGTVGGKTVIFDAEWLFDKIGSARPRWYPMIDNAHPAWVAFDAQGNLYVSLEDIYCILKIDAEDGYTVFEIDKTFFNSTITLGKGSFDVDAIYTTGYNDGAIHKLVLTHDK